jgi:hypothetical protein
MPGTIRTIKLYLKGKYDWRFQVHPGKITYPGTLTFLDNGSDIETPGQSYYYVSMSAISANQAAMMLEKLRDQYPLLIDQYPLANGRTARDDFLTHYQSVVSQLEAQAAEGSAE